MSTLCLDFGNSRLKAAFFQGSAVMEEIILENDPRSKVELLLNNYNPSTSILASVIDHDTEIDSLLNKKTRFHNISPSSKLNFSIAVSNPQSIGADRIALIAGAVNGFPDMNTLVIGLGTCITYNFVNQHAVFLGGAISPGLAMRFQSLHDYTKKLPLVEPSWNFPLIGYDTKTNIQSGVANGIINEIQGFIEKYKNKYKEFNVLLTGGDAHYFASQIKKNTFADPHLLFKGLYVLSELNN